MEKIITKQVPVPVEVYSNVEHRVLHNEAREVGRREIGTRAGAPVRCLSLDRRARCRRMCELVAVLDPGAMDVCEVVRAMHVCGVRAWRG